MAVNRVTGLTNFDVEGMVTKLMDAEKIKVNKVQQNREQKVWEQDAYRSVIDQYNAFKSENFDALKPDSNFRSSSLFAKFTSSIMVNGTASTKVTASGNADIQNFSQQIDSITQLASKDTYLSNTLNLDAIMSKDLSGGNFASGKPTTFQATLTIGSVSKTVQVDMSSVTDLTGFAGALNSGIASAFGSGYTNIASVSGNQLKLRSAGNTVSLIQQTGHEDSLTWLGTTSGTTSTSYQSKTIGDLFSIGASDLSTMSINGKSFTDLGISVTDSVAKMIQKVNASGISATMSYDSLSDKFTLNSSKSGVANQLNVSANMKTKLQLADSGHTAGQDAVLRMNGVDMLKSDNTFTVNGVTVTLNGTQALADGPIKMKFEVNTEAIVNKIKGFVTLYNGLIASTYDKITEPVNRSYLPLTEDQKKAMTDDQIKQWETKAKSGMLRNHTDLEALTMRMRRAMTDPVEGLGINLSQLGITPSSNYKEHGKLIIADETKLRNAIQNNYSDVVHLFSNESSTAYLDTSATTSVSTRYKENGLGNRLYDIMQDAVRTSRDGNGKKGSLLEMAGMKNDLSAYTSTLSKSISDYDDRIKTLLYELSGKEKSYYAKFSAVESALAKMQEQGNQWASMSK